MEEKKLRSWIFEMHLKGIAPKDPVQINGCKLEVVTDETKVSKYVATLKIESESAESAMELASPGARAWAEKEILPKL